MPPEEVAKVKAALTPIVHDNQDHGWQESTDAALTFLLRTSLAKAGKENQGATPITLEMGKDTSRIKKHISSVIDRVTKGSRISDDKNKLEPPSLMDFKIDSEEDDIAAALSDMNSTPVGSHFGEQGERLRSAKVRSKQPVQVHPEHDSNEIIANGNIPNANVKPPAAAASKEVSNEDIEAEKHIINDDDNDDDGEEDAW